MERRRNIKDLDSSEENILDQEMNTSNFPADNNNISISENRDGQNLSITINRSHVDSFLMMNNTLTTYEKAKLFDKIAGKIRMHDNFNINLDL